MKEFGTNEYGNKEGFVVMCTNCGRNAKIVPVSQTNEKGKVVKIILEISCICGNKYGATIYGK
jgi:hypothetical protein